MDEASYQIETSSPRDVETLVSLVRRKVRKYHEAE